jgi:hypothetical protein
MIDTLFALGYATVFAVVVAFFVKQEKYVTLRGRRVAFFIALLVGFVMAQFIMHFYVDCDLRAGATTPCQIGWL